MKQIICYCITLFALVTVLSSCDNAESANTTTVAFGNESGDIFDTLTLTTLRPVTVVTNLELEIENGDTAVVNETKLLKVTVNAGYSQYLAYTGSVVDSALLDVNIPQGYCLVISTLASKTGYAEREAVVMSYAIVKVVNHMGG